MVTQRYVKLSPTLSDWCQNTLKAPQKNAEQLQREKMDGMVENTHFQESLGFLSREAAGRGQRVWEVKKKKLENSTTRVKQVVNHKKSQLKRSMTKTVLERTNLPALFRDYVDHGNLGLDKKNGSENGDHLDYESEVDSKKLIHAVT